MGISLWQARRTAALFLGPLASGVVYWLCVQGPGSAISVDGIAETPDHRLEDRDHRLQLVQIMAIAIARAVVEALGDLGVAGRPRIATIFLEIEAGWVERRADEIEHANHTLFLLVDDVLIADRQVVQCHLAAVMLDQLHDPDVVARRRLQRIAAIEAVRQMIGEDRE